MILAPSVAVLPIKAENSPMVFHPTLIWDGRYQVLFDTGLAGQFSHFVQAIGDLGRSFDQTTQIFITHQDRDHIGGLLEARALVPGLTIVCHPLDRGFVEGTRKLVKKAQAYDLPSDTPLAPAIPGVQTIQDRHVLPMAGGLEAIHTPGHTPGHLCWYHHPSQTLIAGDALNVVDGQLWGPNPVYTHDLAQARKSLVKLADFPIQTIVCYHGGTWTGDVKDRLLALAAQEGEVFP